MSEPYTNATADCALGIDGAVVVEDGGALRRVVDLDCVIACVQAGYGVDTGERHSGVATGLAAVEVVYEDNGALDGCGAIIFVNGARYGASGASVAGASRESAVYTSAMGRLRIVAPFGPAFR